MKIKWSAIIRSITTITQIIANVKKMNHDPIIVKQAAKIDRTLLRLSQEVVELRNYEKQLSRTD